MTNRGVVYMGQGRVDVCDIAFPEFVLRDGPGVNPANMGRKVPSGAILKVVSTNICGSDQHMVRGRTTAPAGLVLGHEITGEVVQVGPDVEFITVGDLCSVPFNIACGRCHNCKAGKTGICLSVNPDRPGSAYGYVDMGGWVGGQANYVLVRAWRVRHRLDKARSHWHYLEPTRRTLPKRCRRYSPIWKGLPATAERNDLIAALLARGVNLVTLQGWSAFDAGDMDVGRAHGRDRTTITIARPYSESLAT